MEKAKTPIPIPDPVSPLCPPIPFDFSEALLRLKTGAKVTREGWDESEHLIIWNDGSLNDGDNFIAHFVQRAYSLWLPTTRVLLNGQFILAE